MSRSSQENGSVPYRRHFLKTSAGIVAASSITSLVSPVHAGADDAIKIALVGCGNRGAGAAPTRCVAWNYSLSESDHSSTEKRCRRLSPQER
ncbi:MAG TPA: twin-arginine translocation signal domain-containing protein [Pirellulaceae bacterium]|jgi:hypothetical protein